VSPFFNTINSFQNFSTPLGAVGGNLAGMNGVMGLGGGAVGNGLGQGMLAGQSDDLLAGPYPLAGELGGFDPTALGGTPDPMDAQPSDAIVPGDAARPVAPRASGTAPAASRSEKKSTRARAKSSVSPGQAARKPVRKSSSSARRRASARSFDPFAELD
jgi:hypothetical protein